VCTRGRRQAAVKTCESRIAELREACGDEAAPKELQDLEAVLEGLWDKVDELKEAIAADQSTKASLKAMIAQIASSIAPEGAQPQQVWLPNLFGVRWLFCGLPAGIWRGPVRPHPKGILERCLNLRIRTQDTLCSVYGH
jgi:hypothetical protein